MNILSTLGSASVDSPDLFSPLGTTPCKDILQETNRLRYIIPSPVAGASSKSVHSRKAQGCAATSAQFWQRNIPHKYDEAATSSSYLPTNVDILIYTIYCTRPNPFFCWILMDPYLPPMGPTRPAPLRSRLPVRDSVPKASC